MKIAQMATAAAALACASVANADIYMHNPRGSNNRLDEANRDRNNGNRLFDSQNNNRGGSNVGSLKYYEGSKLSIEWTNQHSCGNPNNNCEIIIQYMCDDKIRDGTTTQTIPINPTECLNYDCDNDVEYGRQESFQSYMDCKSRERNKGLFTSTQKPKGNTAIYTRQNPNGARRGYECPEERDYYPYWGPTPWVDIAVLTNQPGRCKAYQNASQNVQSRSYCDLPYTYTFSKNKKQRDELKIQAVPITPEECEKVTYKDMYLNPEEEIHGIWRTLKSHGVAAPDCKENFWTRDNHLGNAQNGQTSVYNWTIPSDIIHDQCILRMRYNISTSDIEHFGGDRVVTASALTAEKNGKGNGKNGQTAPIRSLGINEKYGIEPLPADKNGQKAGSVRGYELENNPQTDIFGSLLEDSNKARLQLAINTAQYGRTFQDRSHVFAIKKRTPDLEGKVIHNLNVRGKRGNIVQTFPGTEYDFVPNRLHVKTNDLVHFQWTGSNTNPNNNAGQGKQGTDRHNIVVLRDPNYSEKGHGETTPPTFGNWGNSYPANNQDSGVHFAGLSTEDRQHLAILSNYQMGGELSELDDAGTYFNLEPVAATKKGIYHYLSTRNNNFSNRSQKGKLVVDDVTSTTAHVGRDTGATVSSETGNEKLMVADDAMAGPVQIIVTSYDKTREVKGLDFVPNASIVQVEPVNLPLAEGKTVTVEIAYEDSAASYMTMYRADSLDAGVFEEEVENAEFSNGWATAEVTKGGVFIVKATTNWVAIIFITLAVIGVIAGGVWFFLKKKNGGGYMK